jgi:hypothetical protein
MNSKNKTHSTQRIVTWMYMTATLILSAVLTNACNLLTIYGSGDIVTKNADVHDFNRVNFSGEGEFMLSQGDEETVAIATDGNLIKYINVEVREGTLYIWHRERISPSQPILIRVSVKNITGLELAGIVNAEVNKLDIERLKVDVSGLVKLKMQEIEADTLGVTLNGSSEFNVTGTGDVTKQEITLNGSNSYKAPKLQSQTTNISLNGSNDVTIWAVETMKIAISGQGNVQYYGSPQINQSGSGNAELVSLGEQ